MNKTQKPLMIASWGFLIVATMALVAAAVRRGRHEQADPLPDRAPVFDVPAFSLTDQDGRSITSDNLKGQVWVADFIFTSCQGPCIIMSTKMSELQKTLAGAKIKLVSFTVDPTHDTPAVLKQYGKQYAADNSQWTLVTGSQQAMYDLASGMKIAAQPAQGENPIIHSTKFVLVDRAGHIAGFYNGDKEAGLASLTADALKLAREGSQP